METGTAAQLLGLNRGGLRAGQRLQFTDHVGDLWWVSKCGRPTLVPGDILWCRSEYTHLPQQVMLFISWCQPVGCGGALTGRGAMHCTLAHKLIGTVCPLLLLLQDEQDSRCIDGSLLRQLELVRSARLLRLALICQDLADSMTAINDITGRHTVGAGRHTVVTHTASHTWLPAEALCPHCCVFQAVPHSLYLPPRQPKAHPTANTSCCCTCRAQCCCLTRFCCGVSLAASVFWLQRVATRASTTQWCSAVQACCQQLSARTSTGEHEQEGSRRGVGQWHHGEAPAQQVSSKLFSQLSGCRQPFGCAYMPAATALRL